MKWSSSTYRQSTTNTTTDCADPRSSFIGKGPRKGWRTPLNTIICSEQRDGETGYSYFGARYYDADLLTGWMSVDPMSDKYPSISTYAYCGWNPIKLVDPDGMELEDTKYVTETGSLIVETNDGMNDPFEDVVIIKNEKLEAFTEELRRQDANKTLDQPSSRQKLASFGETLSDYQSSIIQENDDDYYKIGVRATYQDAYEGRHTRGTIFVFCLGASCEVMSEMGTTTAGTLASAAMAACSLGKSDREKGRINRLDPYKTLNKTLPLGASYRRKSQSTENSQDKSMKNHY